MRLSLLLLLISVSAFAQQKKEPDKKGKPVKVDSLDLEFGWDDVFRSAGWDCRCPVSPEQVQNMPRELSPYQWVNKDKPIIIDDSTYRQWVKADEEFKKNYRRADSLSRVKQVPSKPIQ